MRKFTISRLTTSIGFVKLEGTIQQAGRIEVTQFSIMGTDGWVALNVAHSSTQMLLKQIQAQIDSHLRDIECLNYK